MHAPSGTQDEPPSTRAHGARTQDAHGAGHGLASKYRRDPDALLTRLRRIEGQVRGLQRMVEEDRYCVDILVQLAAVRAALDEVGLALLADHTRGCVADALRSGDGEAAIEELLGAVRRFVR